MGASPEALWPDFGFRDNFGDQNFINRPVDRPILGCLEQIWMQNVCLIMANQENKKNRKKIGPEISVLT